MAVAYGLLSYLTAYLKVHYTIYFMAALLTSKSDKVQKISFIINDCKRLGIKVSPPNVNFSNSYFTAIPEKSEILFGLQAIKGMGDSVVTKILEQRPYKGLNDLSDRLQDKSAVITLIKCGAIPTNNKMKSLQKYATLQFPKREYKDVTTTPSPYIKLLDFGLDVKDYKEGRKVDKERLLKDYNNIRRERFNKEQDEKYKKYMEEFFAKYATEEYMWEFQTLSMFLTHDPLESSYDYLDTVWDDIEDGEKAVLLCVIVDIKRKKDKHNNQFAYLDLYTPFGIVEATIWSAQLKNYSENIEKGKCLAILGRKNDGGHFFVEKVKPYSQWLNDKIFKKKGATDGK